MTRYSFQGACHTGRGHLLGIRRAIAADGLYSSCPPPACCAPAVSGSKSHQCSGQLAIDFD